MSDVLIALGNLRVDISIGSAILREYVSLNGETEILNIKVKEIAQYWNDTLLNERKIFR